MSKLFHRLIQNTYMLNRFDNFMLHFSKRGAPITNLTILGFLFELVVLELIDGVLCLLYCIP
uniref:Uncharacterized protein n=1 Tax=Arundo donax TaxID=35708 RepID=A0A0A9DPP5_ARUDO